MADFYNNNGIPDLANKILFEISGLTIAVNNMDAMKDFYTNVFNVNFKPVKKFNTTLYEGNWGDFSLLLCPAEVAKIDAKVNRHQFDILVNDLGKAMDLVVANGGKVEEETGNESDGPAITVFDPDGNSIVIKLRN